MTGAIALPDPDNPEDPPPETEGVGEDPGTVPADEPAQQPADPSDPEPCASETDT